MLYIYMSSNNPCALDIILPQDRACFNPCVLPRSGDKDGLQGRSESACPLSELLVVFRLEQIAELPCLVHNPVPLLDRIAGQLLVPLFLTADLQDLLLELLLVREPLRLYRIEGVSYIVAHIPPALGGQGAEPVEGPPGGRMLTN